MEIGKNSKDWRESGNEIILESGFGNKKDRRRHVITPHKGEPQYESRRGSTERGSTSTACITTIMGPRASSWIIHWGRWALRSRDPSASSIHMYTTHLQSRVRASSGFSSFVTRLYTIAHKYLVDLRSGSLKFVNRRAEASTRVVVDIYENL